MKKFHILILILLGYIVSQLLAIYLQNSIFIILYLVLYLYNIILGIFWLKSEFKWNTIIKYLLLTLTSNIILTLIYLKIFYFNPEINWKLKGDFEQDPIILYTYLPSVFFIISIFIFIISTFIIWIINKNKSQKT